jgi:hypothetical protein
MSEAQNPWKHKGKQTMTTKTTPTTEQLAADAERMNGVIENEQKPTRRAHKSTAKTAAEGFAAIDQLAAARAGARRPRAVKAPVKAAAAIAAPKRVMAEDAFGKYIQRQELLGHVVTTLAVEREAGSDGKPKYLSASYEVATPKGKVLGVVRFDHGRWFVVGDNDETKVPTIGKGILALAGK